MKLNKITELCNEADRLLAVHVNDASIPGYARTKAQGEFARLGYPLLALLCEGVRELVAEVARLAAQNKGLRLVLHRRRKNAKWWKDLSTEREQEIDELKAAAKLDAAMLAHQCDLARKAELEVAELKEQLRLARMRAVSQGEGRLPR